MDRPGSQRGAKFWLGVLTELQQRGLEDVFIWRRHWDNIIPIFDYPADIRRAVYTTNIIESLNYSLKKSVKLKGAFPTEDALFKILYLAIDKASQKWTMPIKDWKKALNRFAQLFGDRLLDRLHTQN